MYPPANIIICGVKIPLLEKYSTHNNFIYNYADDRCSINVELYIYNNQCNWTGICKHTNRYIYCNVIKGESFKIFKERFEKMVFDDMSNSPIVIKWFGQKYLTRVLE